MLPDSGAAQVDLGSGMSVTVLGPSKQRISELLQYWLKQLESGQSGAGVSPDKVEELTIEPFSSDRIRILGGKELVAQPAAYVDASVANLASIVLMLELGGKSILLTSDGRGDEILAGLARGGYLSVDGAAHVDLMTLPHQGSDRNVTGEFFRAVTADSYVISGNGSHGNPEPATLSMLTEARGDARYAMYFTNSEGKEDLSQRLQDFFSSEGNLGRRYEVHFRAQGQSSMKVNLVGKLRD